jgi:Tol biopolymer transport system component
MTLSAGSRLGPYEIVSPLGAGGMGEVYRAKDTRLDRTVAVKVLPAHLSSSAESRQRFEREAKTISQLSHPHICALYDVGREGETEYLVMEYLEGETLSDRLAKGALPLEQTLRYGIEIADALDKAHRQGIVHRDLKPGNVMLTKSGVKLLDFGLAKAIAPAASPAALTSLPTAMGSPNLTQEGTILGTFQYMAPEQLEGKEADARTDIFAFGATVYEMATGKKAFSGSSRASLITAIMSSEPAAISSLQPMTPPALDRVVKTCLAKDPEDRWQSAADVAKELRWAVEAPAVAVEPSARRRERVAWIACGAAVLAAVGLAIFHFPQRPTRPQPVRFSILPPENAKFRVGVEFHNVAVSPDGSRVAFVAVREGQDTIWMRLLDAQSPLSLPATEGASSPFWSPDGASLGFFADGKLKKISLAGGPAQTICDASGKNAGAWGRAGTMLFTQIFSPKDGLYAVPASGGAAQPISVAYEQIRWPYFLPDGRRFLCLGRSPKEWAGFLLAGDLDSPEVHRVAPLQSRVELSRNGELFYVREGNLVARAFDPTKLRFTGDAVPVAEKMPYFSPTGWAPFAVSETGVLAYQAWSAPPQLRWVDRKGQTVGTVGPPGLYSSLRLSPDGRKAAIEKKDPATGTSDLWIGELSREVMTRFTSEPGLESCPVWSADGSEIAFISHGMAPEVIRRERLADSGGGEVLVSAKGFPIPSDWSSDGRVLAYQNLDEKTGWDIWVQPVSGTGKAFPFRQTHFNEAFASFSPDGRWVVFLSDESGRTEVYAAPFPESGPKWQVSTAGASQEEPLRWRGDGKELFYVAADGQLMAVPVRPRPGSFESGAPVPLFRLDSEVWSGYDVAADGQRFLVSSLQEDSLPITVVLNRAGEPK